MMKQRQPSKSDTAGTRGGGEEDIRIKTFISEDNI